MYIYIYIYVLSVHTTPIIPYCTHLGEPQLKEEQKQWPSYSSGRPMSVLYHDPVHAQIINLLSVRYMQVTMSVGT